ncbi:unnamed protein product [Ixodes persulcatus]
MSTKLFQELYHISLLPLHERVRGEMHGYSPVFVNTFHSLSSRIYLQKQSPRSKGNISGTCFPTKTQSFRANERSNARSLDNYVITVKLAPGGKYLRHMLTDQLKV